MSRRPLLLATAIEAVVRAGAIHTAYRGTGFRVDKKGIIDLVTEADLAVEVMFRRLIAERFPDHTVMAEEMGAGAVADNPGASHCWIFDPLDGTTNYAHGLPIYCASLALEIDSRVELCAVYDPSREELFVAERGAGAFLNGSPLRVSGTTALMDSILVTGFPYDVHQRLDQVVGLFGAYVGRSRAIRRLGSAALDLCWLAAGRTDGFWEQGLKPWDAAAGALVVEEAGGRVSRFDGAPFSVRQPQILASNGLIHDDMIDIVRDFRAGNPLDTSR